MGPLLAELLFDYWKEKDAAVAAVDKRVVEYVVANAEIPLRLLAPMFKLTLPQLQYVLKKAGVTLKNGRKFDGQ